MLDGERVHPALTRRLADTELNPGTDQFCMVRQAEDSDTFGTVTCDGLGIVPQGFRLIVPEDAISASGPLARVMVGDLVRVHGHGVIRKVYEASGLRRSGRSSSRWQIEEIPAEGISIAVRSTCCSAPVPEAEE